MPFMIFTGTGYTPLRPRSLELLIEDKVCKKKQRKSTHFFFEIKLVITYCACVWI